MGFGVSNPFSNASVGNYGSDFACNGGWCYELTNLYEFNWDSTIPFYDGELSFQEAFGDFSDNVEPGENTINWYSSLDGALRPGDFEDFFLFQADAPASLALGILEGPDTVFFNQAPVSQVPLPAAVWLFGSALLGLGAVKRKQA